MTAWIPSKVQLADGSVVDSDSRAWIAECEARTILLMDYSRQREHLALLLQKRGEDAVRDVRNLMHDVEPAFLLGLPSQDARRAYLRRVEHDRGQNARSNLEARSLALWESRKPAKGNAA